MIQRMRRFISNLLTRWRLRTYVEDVDADFAEARRVRDEARAWNDAKCRQAVDTLLSDNGQSHSKSARKAWLAYQGLQECKETRLPALVGALADDRLVEMLPNDRDRMRGWFSDTSAGRITRMLKDYESLPATALEPLRQLAAHPNVDLAAEARQLLIRCGELPTPDELRRDLSDPSTDDFKEATRTIRTLAEVPCGRSVIIELWPRLLELLGGDLGFRVAETFTGTMLAVDRDRAVNDLVDILTTDPLGRNTRGIAEGLHESGVWLPPTRLIPMVRACIDDEGELRATSVNKAGQLLNLGIGSTDTAWVELLQSLIQHPDEKLRLTAIPIWANARGLSEQFLPGASNLTESASPTVKRWANAFYLIHWSRNDGLEQPVMAEELLKSGVTALVAAGAVDLADVFRRARERLETVDDPFEGEVLTGFFDEMLGLTEDAQIKLWRYADAERATFNASLPRR
ncbi:MAG: hypothetical protein AAF663_10745 [Planctomycetota bacterium]